MERASYLVRGKGTQCTDSGSAFTNNVDLGRVLGMLLMLGPYGGDFHSAQIKATYCRPVFSRTVQNLLLFRTSKDVGDWAAVIGDK